MLPHVDTILPLLSKCVSASDAMPLQAALTEAFGELAASAGAAARGRLAEQQRAIQAVASSAELRVLAARLLRELMQAQASSPQAAEAAAATLPSRKQQRQARLERAQKRALDAHKGAAARPTQQPVETLPGVGPSLGQALRARGLATLADLIWLLPLEYLDERTLTPITELRPGARQVTEGAVLRASGGGFRGRGGRPAEVLLEAAGPAGGVGQLRLLWFRAPAGLLARFAPGSRYRVSGIVESFRGQLQMAHPETARLDERASAAPPGIVPRYPVIAGVPPRRLSSCIRTSLERALPDQDEALPEALRRTHGLSRLADALRALHTPPATLADAELLAWNGGATAHHARLAFEEFFLLELALFRRRVYEQGVVAEALVPVSGDAPIARVRAAFGFELTSAQRRVSDEIAADLAGTRPMRRLLQGDVGSGKTAVALLAAAHCIAAGAQVAFMAPTEVLAEQHFRTLGPLSAALGLRAALMLGGERAAHRKQARKALAAGSLDLVVGTHALLSEGVQFARLRLAIIDEQHRFGVGQRLRLQDKCEDGTAPHLLVMTATPIPRTLSLALYGDLSTSVIDRLPEGRIPPVTRAYPKAERERALAQLERALEAGGQAFVVCATIEESDEHDLRAVEQSYAELGERFARYGVVLLHGRLAAPAKAAAMEQFLRGEKRVMVATTVIEVGIDVPSANVIMIEDAERFGLSQLHQLRGRVGRAGQRSACLLVHQAYSADARARMQVMCETCDGFAIAEADLRLRGPGELFGHRQSGLPGFRFGDLRRDAPLLEAARAAAQRVIEHDPELRADEHAPARRILDRFGEGVRKVVKEEAG